MHALLIALALATSFPAVTVDSGTQLVFTGSFVAEKGSAAETEKKFTLSLLLADVNASGAGVYWALEEQGRGGWSWIHRFGHYRAGRVDGEGEPTLLYERPEGTSEIPLLSPLFFRDPPLAAGMKWQVGRFDHEVKGTEKLGDTAVWSVEVSNAYGLKRAMLIDQANPLIMSLKENVFIGQGEKHELTYELTSVMQLNSAQAQTGSAAFDGLMALRNRLGIVPGTRDTKWTDERLAMLREQLPAATANIKDGPLLGIARDAERDSKDQKDRAGAVELMRGKLVGNAAPRPELRQLNYEAFDWSQTEGKVTVLHFWEYRDTPLEEPYGQIAYLDFLFRNRPSENVAVFGVCVNQLLQDPETQSKAALSAKKLIAFMNLSYPILADYGGGLRQFGDPRVTGAKLPLFVVIGKDGKIIHYHVGTYEVNRDRGLEELDAIVKKAVGSLE
ncbi:MAG: redoxin family protein [Planctomycetaceae bacterium]|nr:redoxin family protein [Planctomycetales bacterium]MCB9924646.1 redoxin family protein [Planctomycetaceae bacterium]